MSKKNTMKKAVATFLGASLIFGGSACTFFPANSERDLKQTVATVDVSKGLKNDETYAEHASSVEKLVKDGYLNKKILKSDLISAFLSTGYNYVQSYGYTYEQTFNQLMDLLVNRKIITQYAIAYYLENKELSIEGCEAYVEENMGENVGAAKKDVLKQVYALQYFLTENGTDKTDYNYAIYQLKSSLNSSLDSMESEYITSSEEHNHNENARIKPTNVTQAKEDYYPQKEDGSLDYDIYTGRNPLDLCGEYEKVDGSTTATRQKAYNAFLANLQSSNLINKGEDTSDVTSLAYYYEELANTLAQALINKYGDDLKEDAVKKMTAEFVESKYDETLEAQELAYGTGDFTAFETALEGISADAPVLYGQKDFGFVYNILIPFSASQKQAYSAAKNRNLTESELFSARRSILKGVEAKDLRNEWFDVHDHANSAYEVVAKDCYDNGLEKGEKTYLFFEDNFGENSKNEALTQYAGLYPYNGKVELVDEKYEFTPEKLGIDAFIAEMESYIEYVSGVEAKGAKKESYNTTSFKKDGVVDYNNFTYYEGKVELKETDAKDFFNKESDQYKALSAVNELMFAYSTDEGCLNKYMGYVVSPYKTSYVAEFEAAAQYVVKQGVGSYVVCATDYGWHIIYTSFVYSGGEVYGGYIDAEKDTEGTFSNLFYESLKDTLADKYIDEENNSILNEYYNDDCVTLYKSTYKDLLEMDL